MHLRSIQSTVVVLLLMSGCAGHRPKSVEVLDSRSGMTVGALPEPMTFMERGVFAPLDTGKRPSFAYLGPVEWDRSGDYSYGFWIQVGPGDGKRIGDIHAPGALTLEFSTESVTLSAMETPKVAADPYPLMAPGAQTAYFRISAGMLRRMAASRALELNLLAADLSSVHFTPLRETHSALMQFVQARDIAD